MMALDVETASKALGAHGIGAGAPPKNAELWEQFKNCGPTKPVKMSVENRFYIGCDHDKLDWTRPVHAVFIDFKGDSMQVGMLLARLACRGEQFVFVAGSNPGFNGGFHFTAVNDFEHPSEQQALDPSWRDIRIWTRLTYVCSTAADGSPALTPRALFNPEAKHDGAIPVAAGFKFSSLIFTGGLMPHTMNATAIADNAPMSGVIAKHMELGATFAAVGHGLDVLIACGTLDCSLVAGFEAAVFPRQDRLLEISGMQKAAGEVCVSRGTSGATLISASYWGVATVPSWLDALKLAATTTDGKDSMLAVKTEEVVLALDVGDLPGMVGSTCLFGEPLAPRSAVFVDDVADPIEIFTMISHLMQERLSFQLISHSMEGVPETRKVVSETVFGNPMYGLKEVTCIVPTTPANLVPADVAFDSFFVAGGQCPYHMMNDPGILSIMDKADIAAAVCHGPEALLGSKWMRPEAGRFTAYFGCWMSFRDLMGRYERKKPGETSADGRLFSGNAPNATKPMVEQACAAIQELRGGK